jgi:hypothetical protein
MIDSLLDRLDVAVEHRRVRAQPGAMRPLGNADPFVGGQLLRIDLLVDALGEDLGAASRERSEPGGLEILEDLLEGLLEPLSEEVVLGSGEGLDVELRGELADSAQEVCVEAVGKVGVVPSDDVHLGHRLGQAFTDLLQALVDRPCPPARLLPVRTVEAAELAVDDAHVRRIEMHVADEVGAIAVLPFADQVRQCAGGDEVARPEQT